MYVNGSPIAMTYTSGSASTTDFFDDIATTQNYWIGNIKFSGSFYHFLDGKLDDIRLYDTALTEIEIQTVMNENIKVFVHYLTISLSNCIYNGNVFLADIEVLEALIQTEFEAISNLEFRGVGCSMVRGDTDSLTIGISASFYTNKANVIESEALTLRNAANNAISNISNLTVAELRVESTNIGN